MKGNCDLRCAKLMEGMGAKEISAICKFVLRWKKEDGNRNLRMVEACLQHSCPQNTGSYGERKRCISLKRLQLVPGISNIMNHVAVDSSNSVGKRKGSQAKALQASFFAQSKIPISLRTAQKFCQEKSGATFENYLRNV